jgi:hypothetical protein
MSTSYSNSNELDIQDVDSDIDSLYSKYIIPIENVRSKASVNVFSPSSASSMTKDSQESRAHAFYRMLGLPIIASNGSFYNPGFNPQNTGGTLAMHTSVDNGVDKIVQQMQFKRENDSKLRLSLYKNQDLNTMVSSLSLISPYGQRPFDVMQGSNPFGAQSTNSSTGSSSTGVDYQSNPNINQISSYLNYFFKTVDGYNLSPVSSSHMVRPLTTDPATCNGVMPKINLMCVPFPNSNDTYIESKTQLKRCGLEFILRLRLRQRVINSEVNQPVTPQSLITLFGNSGDITINDLASISGVLLDKSTVDTSSIADALKGVLLTEIYYLNDLNKMLRGALSEMVKSAKALNAIMAQIVYTPMSAINGPEGGSQITSGFISPNFPQKYDLENKIMVLQIKINIASLQQDLGSSTTNPIDFSSFGISEFHNLKNDFSDQLQEAQNQKTTYEKQASDYLRKIEIVLGEVSGFGLINVIATYMALWSVDLSVLLNLLDNDAANRLYNIPELRTQEVSNRKNATSVDPIAAITTLDNAVKSILASCDKIKADILFSK